MPSKFITSILLHIYIHCYLLKSISMTLSLSCTAEQKLLCATSFSYFLWSCSYPFVLWQVSDYFFLILKKED